jgi:poly-gamma-glutamate system protein
MFHLPFINAIRKYAGVVFIAVTLMAMTVLFAAGKKHPAFNLMVEAAEKEKRAEHELYTEKVTLGLFDPEVDPHHTGIVGEEYSRITTTLGVLKAKRTAANPDFAAYIVRELSDHGIGAGDSVLVTMTGSFPGMNLAVLMALETLEVSSLRICSLGASSYGANQEKFTWIDMEDLLVKESLLNRRSDWVTLGGSGDVGGGLPEGARGFLKRKAERLGYSILQSRSPKKQAEARRELVGSPTNYKLLINIGGNQAMLGGAEGRELPGGWLDPVPTPMEDGTPDELEGIVFDFLEEGVPVLNLLHIEDIATAAGIPFDPPEIAEPGQSPVYFLDVPEEEPH